MSRSLFERSLKHTGAAEDDEDVPRAVSSETSSIRGARSVSRSRAPGVFVIKTATMRTHSSNRSIASWSAALASPPLDTARIGLLPPSSAACKSLTSCASRASDSAPGARVSSRATKVKARDVSSSGVSSEPGRAATHVLAFSKSMRETPMSSRPKSTSCCAQPWRTVSKFTRALMSLTAEPSALEGMPGMFIPAPISRIAFIIGAADDSSPSPTSSRRAMTSGFVHFSSTAAAKVSPSRSRLQTAPAARPHRRQFIGFSCLLSAVTSSSRKVASCSLKTGRPCPARQMFPRALTASSAALLLESPANMSSKTESRPSMPPPSPPRRSEACLARSSKPGGSMFSFESLDTISTSVRRWGSG
mmetsp:Transcript_139073/g.444144  ORF Transcript_139073/g.444144 Transcript_139073/m.444144 type:complete len:361 (-) Transcript_139073:1840-2922(-)